MSGLTISEKILSRAAGHAVRAGEIAICVPDFAMGTDGSIPLALDYLRQMRATAAAPVRRERLLFALDHYGAASGAKALALQDRVRSYARLYGVALLEVGAGIGHQIVLDAGFARPGQLMVGADSHAVSYGAANAFATGIGSSDLAALLFCGEIWLKVPETLRIVLSGRLREETSAKDVALYLARTLGSDGANYRALEFSGLALKTLDMDDRSVLANMSVEVGAKAGLFPCDEVTRDWLQGRTQKPYESIVADSDAAYAGTINIDLAAIAPQIALPDRVDNVVDLSVAPSTRIDVVYLGTCTGGRIKDFREALEVLKKAGGIASGVTLVVTPASEAIRAELEQSGMLAEFTSLGAQIQPPGCGSCCGTCGMIPADNANVISTANRNFKGRMGNGKAAIFLASPKACAAAASRGAIGGMS